MRIGVDALEPLESTTPIVSRPERLDPSEQVEVAIPATARAMRDVYESRFARLGLNFKQALIIGHLDVAELHTLNQTEVAQLAGIRKPVAGTAIDNLVARGLVERIADPNDRRAKLVSLTDAGSRLAVDVDRAFGELASALRRNTTAEQRRMLVAALRVLQENLTAMVDGRPATSHDGAASRV